MKHWYESKTLWLNVLVALVAILQFVAGDSFPVDISADAAAWIALAIAVANGVLRFLTDKKIVV